METADAEQKTSGINEYSFQKHATTTASEFAKLTIKVLDTIFMTVGAEYEITPKGLKSSKRTTKDGCVYAGSEEKQGRVFINDIILPEQEKGVGKRHFMIQYNKGGFYIEKASYSIKDMGEGMGTFIHLSKPIPVSTSYIISFGDSHMVIQIDDSILTLRFIEGPKADFIR